MAMTQSMTKYLKPLRSAALRSKIRKNAFRMGFEMSKMNDGNREFLAEAVFAIENDREHSYGVQDPHVVAMRGIRNKLYDDLRWNEVKP